MEQGYDIRDELPIRLNEAPSSVKDWIDGLIREHNRVHTTSYEDGLLLRGILGEERYKYVMEEWEWGYEYIILFSDDQSHSERQ